jgi:WD40 repeat protein
MKFQLLSELTPTRFAEIGHPTDAYTKEDGQFVALCSSFGPFYWPGRAIYAGHSLRSRISLYTNDLAQRIAVFDGTRFPINDLAFHPSQPLLAIGTGAYDGGYFYEGQLWLWNWESQESYALLKESREVLCCYFLDENRLAVVVSPANDGDFGDHLIEFYFVDIAQAGHSKRLELQPLDPQEFGFSDYEAYTEQKQQSALALLSATHDYHPRGKIWDLLWLSEQKIALVDDIGLIEVWNTNGTCEYAQTAIGLGVQLLAHPQGPLVNSLKYSPDSGNKTRSVLYRLKQPLKEVYAFKHAMVFSVDQNGQLLCRDSDNPSNKRPRQDMWLDANLKKIQSKDIGYYDCFNHYLRLDQGEGLYFLQGTPASSHQKKKLCRLHLDGTIEPIMNWDNHAAHLMNSIACWGPQNTLIRSFKIYNPQPDHRDIRIESVDLSSGKTLWTCQMSALVTAMVLVENTHLAYALTNGKMGLIDIARGRIIKEQNLTIDGIKSVALSLSAKGSLLATGTQEGRLLLYQIR